MVVLGLAELPNLRESKNAAISRDASRVAKFARESPVALLLLMGRAARTLRNAVSH